LLIVSAIFALFHPCSVLIYSVWLFRIFQWFCGLGSDRIGLAWDRRDPSWYMMRVGECTVIKVHYQSLRYSMTSNKSRLVLSMP